MSVIPPPPQAKRTLATPGECTSESKTTTTTTTTTSSSSSSSSSTATPSPPGRRPLTDSVESRRICEEYMNMLWNEEQKPFFTEATVGASIASQSPELSRPSWDRTQKRMNKCKLKHRSDFVLDDWHKYNHLEGKPEHVRLGSDCTYPINPSIDRVRCNHLSTERFVRQYERTATPVVLTGCADHWMARTNWTFEELLKKYGNTLFKCGEDDEGYKVKIKLKYFLEYVTKQKDDSPMYVFDNSFDEHPVAKALMNDFEGELCFFQK